MGSAALHTAGVPEPISQFGNFSPETGEVLDAGCHSPVGAKGGNQGERAVFHVVGNTGGKRTDASAADTNACDVTSATFPVCEVRVASIHCIVQRFLAVFEVDR